jgi:hypothetical protein
MASNVYQIVRAAIAAKKQILATYQGLPREMCPHCIGLNKNDGEQALFFQFAGESKSGLPPGGQWRCLDLSELSNVISRDGPWHSGDSHKKPQTCVKDIDLEVSH